MIIKTIFEFSLIGFMIFALFNEQKFAEFEEKAKEKFKNFLKR